MPCLNNEDDDIFSESKYNVIQICRTLKYHNFIKRNSILNKICCIIQNNV